MQTIIKRETNGSRRVSFTSDEASLTEQTHANAANINSIMKKFNRTGVLPNPVSEGVYGDFSTATDYHDAQNRILQAESQFMDLPSHVRTRFDNDPGKLFEFVNDPDNAEEGREMGLLPPLPRKDPPEPPEPIVAPSPPVAAPAQPDPVLPV